MQHSKMIKSVLVAGVLLYLPPASAGPFTATGVSIENVVQSSYRHSTKPTTDRVIDFTRQTGRVSLETARDTYRHATKPALQATGRIVDDTAKHSTAASDYSTEISAPVARATGETVDKSKPTVDATATASYRASEQSTKATDYSTEVTAPVTDATIEVTQKSAEQTTETSEYSTEASAPVIKATKESSRNTAEQSTEASKFSTEKSQPVIEKSAQTSEYSSEVSGKGSRLTADVARKSADATTQYAGVTREFSAGSSGQLDASLEQTTRLTRKDYQTKLLDPYTADQLIKEAYAFNGTTLAFFSAALSVPASALAETIIDVMPADATRTQLQQIMTYIIPALDARQL